MFPAFLDTCTLYGAYRCDSLLRLAETGTYRPLWSADVLNELERVLVTRGLPPRIRQPGSDYGGYLQVTGRLGLIPQHLAGVDALIGKPLVKHAPRPGARLPVDHAQPRPLQIGETCDIGSQLRTRERQRDESIADWASATLEPVPPAGATGQALTWGAGAPGPNTSSTLSPRARESANPTRSELTDLPDSTAAMNWRDTPAIPASCACENPLACRASCKRVPSFPLAPACPGIPSPLPSLPRRHHQPHPAITFRNGYPAITLPSPSPSNLPSTPRDLIRGSPVTDMKRLGRPMRPAAGNPRCG